MQQRRELTNLEDVQLLVDQFYGVARSNPLLGPIFNNTIDNDWLEHLEKMYRFWQTILLGQHTYFGSPFPPHVKLPLTPAHFKEWLNLWHQTIDTFFIGSKADEAKWRAEKMATVFVAKLQHLQYNPQITIIS